MEARSDASMSARARVKTGESSCSRAMPRPHLAHTIDQSLSHWLAPSPDHPSPASAAGGLGTDIRLAPGVMHAGGEGRRGEGGQTSSARVEAEGGHEHVEPVLDRHALGRSVQILPRIHCMCVASAPT